MNTYHYQENRRAFKATCADEKTHENEQFLYKFCNMFGPKTMLFCKKSGRISTRTGHKHPTQKKA